MIFLCPCQKCTDPTFAFSPGSLRTVLNYYVTVYTGDCYNAGTDAQVSLNLTGASGDTGLRQLCKSEPPKEKLFQKGSVSEGENLNWDRWNETQIECLQNLSTRMCHETGTLLSKTVTHCNRVTLLFYRRWILSSLKPLTSVNCKKCSFRMTLSVLVLGGSWRRWLFPKARVLRTRHARSHATGERFEVVCF